MSNRTQYQNSFGTVITELQKNNLSEYYKLEYDLITNELKTKIHYLEENTINEGHYFMNSLETINDVITKIDNTHRWGIFSNYEQINGYNVWRKNYFQNGELSNSYGKIVFNNKGEEIASIGFDADNQPSRGCSKIFNLSNKNLISDGEIDGTFKNGDNIIFGHKNDGSFTAWTNTELFIKPYKSLERFLEENEGGYILNLMTQEMRDYFLNFEPFIPNFQI